MWLRTYAYTYTHGVVVPHVSNSSFEERQDLRKAHASMALACVPRVAHLRLPLRQQDDTCTNCGQSIEVRCGVRPEYRYRSEACKFPPCVGRGRNGRGCTEPRPKLDRNGKRLRFDEERKWTCTYCRQESTGNKATVSERQVHVKKRL